MQSQRSRPPSIAKPHPSKLKTEVAN